MGRKTNFQPTVKQLRIWLNKYSRDTFPDVEEKSLALTCIKARLWFLSVFLQMKASRLLPLENWVRYYFISKEFGKLRGWKGIDKQKVHRLALQLESTA